MNGLHVEDRGNARWITLDRPDCRNALTPELIEAVGTAVRGATDAGARCIVLAGRNEAFCSGLDLRVAMDGGAELLHDAHAHLARFQGAIRAIVEAPQPTVAVLDGVAFGFGADLALACDLRVASTRAYFQEGFTRIGLIPDGGGTWMLPRLIGLSKALELTLLADKLDATAANHLGLLCRLVEPAELQTAAEAVVSKLANGAPIALRHIKQLMRQGLEKPFREAFEAEGNAQVECVRSSDCIEGITAFFQKRPPNFQGA